MDLLEYATNPEKEVAGAEVKVDAETTLIIARYNNKQFKKYQARLIEPYLKMNGREGVDDVTTEKILCKVMAKHILMGWTGLKLEGELVEYSEEKAFEILSDPRLADFRETVLLESQQLDNYRIERLNDDLGKSNGLSNTEQGGPKTSKSSSKTSKRIRPAKRRQPAKRT